MCILTCQIPSEPGIPDHGDRPLTILFMLAFHARNNENREEKYEKPRNRAENYDLSQVRTRNQDRALAAGGEHMQTHHAIHGHLLCKKP